MLATLNLTIFVKNRKSATFRMTAVSEFLSSPNSLLHFTSHHGTFSLTHSVTALDGNDKDEEEEESKQKEAKWKDFPLDISMQIEALYCQWQSDLRRPGQLVEIAVNGQFQEKVKRKRKDEQRKEGEGGGNKEDLKNNIFANGRKYGIITKPRGWHDNMSESERKKKKRNKMKESEKKIDEYVPYSADCEEVRVMEINPMRTRQDVVLYWMNGPLYNTGRVIRVDWSERTMWRWIHRNAPKHMVLERFQDNLKRYKVVTHPMPKRKDIYGTNSKVFCSEIHKF